MPGVARPRALYRTAPDDLRNTMNFVCFGKLFIDVEDDEPVVSSENSAGTIKPLTSWLEQAGALPRRSQLFWDMKKPEPPSEARVSIRTSVVELQGIEPWSSAASVRLLRVQSALCFIEPHRSRGQVGDGL